MSEEPKTCVLKVYIHCDGCKKDVRKALEKIEGVVKVDVDKEEGKATVTGEVDPDILIKTLKKKLNKTAALE